MMIRVAARPNASTRDSALTARDAMPRCRSKARTLCKDKSLTSPRRVRGLALERGTQRTAAGSGTLTDKAAPVMVRRALLASYLEQRL